MPRRHEIALPEPLAQQFAALERQLRNLALLRGLGRTAAVAAVAAGLALLADLQWALDPPVRLGMLAVGGACVLATAVVSVVRPLLRRFSLEELAAIVEQAHPQFAERLLSTVELNDPQRAGEYRGSAYMRALLNRQTLRSANQVRFAESVSPRRTFYAALSAVLAIAVLLMPVFWSPAGYGLLWARLLNPWGNYDRGGNLYFAVEGGDRTIARGDDVVIRAEPRWRAAPEAPPAVVRLNWINSGGAADSRIMELDEGVYTATIPRVSRPFQFHVSSDEARTRDYRIYVADRPEIVTATLDVDPPAYTGRPAEVHDGIIGEIPVFERSVLRFHLEFNKPVEQAELVWLEAEDDESDGRLRLDVSGTGRNASLSWTALRGGPFAFRVVDEHGLTNIDEPLRRIVLTPDAPPVLQVAGGSEPRRAQPSEVVPMPVSAYDDIGLAALELQYEIGQRDKGTISVDRGQLGGGAVEHEFELDLGALGVNDGEVLTYKVRAADERPVPGPNEVWSEPRSIIVDQNAPPAGAEELARRRESQRNALEQIREQLEQNREQVAELRDAASEAAENQAEGFERDEELSDRAREQQALAQKLTDLAARVGEHPLFSKLMEKAQQLARDELAEGSSQLQEAANAELPEMTEALQKNADQLADAKDELDQLQQAFEQLTALEQDLLALERLAQQAEALAERAAAAEQTPASRHALQQEQDALAEMLNGLLERRPELLEAARQNQQQHLAELAEQARQLAESQERLAEAVGQQPDGMAAEDAEAVAQAEEAQERQQNLVEQAAALAMNIARQTGAESAATQQAAEAARQADEARRDVEFGELERAGEQLEEAAKSAAETSQQLSRPEQPASPEVQQQARELAQALAEQAERLSELSKSPAACRACQSAGQQQLAGAAAGLGRQLAEAAQRMKSDPLNQNDAGGQASDAQQATEQAAQRMNEASEQISGNQSGVAAESGRQAADHLREAGELASQAAANPPSTSPVPPDLAGQVAEAARHLAEAQAQLAQQGNSPAAQSGSPMASGEQASGESQQPSSGSPSAGSQALAQALQQAAQALSQAVQQLQPGSGTVPPQDGQPGDVAGNSGSGALTPAGIQMLEAELQRMTSSRQWGQLSSELRTEILQAARKQPHSDYAHLIKLYFEEIAKPAEDPRE